MKNATYVGIIIRVQRKSHCAGMRIGSPRSASANEFLLPLQAKTIPTIIRDNCFIRIYGLYSLRFQIYCANFWRILDYFIYSDISMQNMRVVLFKRLVILAAKVADPY